MSGNYRDDFSQADENPLSSGGKWNAGTIYTGFGNLKVVSQQVQIAIAASATDGLTTTAQTFDADQGVSISIPTFTSGEVGLAVRANASGALTCYEARALAGAGAGTFIKEWTAGVPADLASAANTWAPGDTMKFFIRGSTMWVWQNGALIVTTSDTTITGIGTMVGILVNLSTGQPTTDIKLDNFSGGDFGLSQVMFRGA